MAEFLVLTVTGKTYVAAASRRFEFSDTVVNTSSAQPIKDAAVLGPLEA